MMMERFSQRKQTSGFTLIELLVVIAIIAILASLALPSLMYAREVAMQIQCMNNQRELGKAVQNYTDDYSGTLPSSETWIGDTWSYLGAYMKVDALAQNRENMPSILFCPCDNDPYPKPFMTGTMEVTSYMVNGAATDFAMGGGRSINVGLFGGNITMGNIKSASECMMLGETTNYGKVVDLDHPAVQSAFARVGSSLNDARTRFHHRSTSGFYHHDSMSVFFVDGHSAMVSGKRVDTLPLSLWPGSAIMNDSTTFYPNLSLPSALDNPAFWGPTYTN